MGVFLDFDFEDAASRPQMTAEQTATWNEQQSARASRDAEKIDTIERAREIAIEMGFPAATDAALKDLMNYAANKNAREFGDSYSIDYQMRYANRKDFDRYLAGTCAQYGLTQTQSPAPQTPGL